jgi:hypothetical protein
MRFMYVYVYTYSFDNFTRVENAVCGISLSWLWDMELKEMQTYNVIVRADSETYISIYLQVS